MKVVIENPKTFRAAIETISQIIDEGVFKFTSEGLEFSAPDRATVAAIILRVPKTSFSEYSVENEVSVGLNIPSLLSILKRASGKLELSVENDKLWLTVTGTSVRKFSLPILNITEEIPPVDKFEFSAKVVVSSDVFEDGINDAEIVADSVIIEVSGEEFRMKAEGTVSSTELVAKKGEGVVEISGEAKARYPIDYLKKFTKATKLVENVSVSFSTDYPMRIDVSRNDIEISMILAPRVEE
ncbi:MAG: DNA polymerase sliding clamp [Candidatus Micrarchaeota archaeon]|nr:DNA polymerase sliding clamp [Candidatus Micrarchaeota archaeon]